MTVSTRSIIEHLDVIEDLGAGNVARCIDPFFDPFFLQAAEEGFRHRVIPTVPTPAHAGLEMVLAAEAQPGVAAILRSLIRMNQRFLWVAAPHRHQDRIQHRFPRHGTRITPFFTAREALIKSPLPPGEGQGEGDRTIASA